MASASLIMNADDVISCLASTYLLELLRRLLFVLVVRRYRRYANRWGLGPGGLCFLLVISHAHDMA